MYEIEINKIYQMDCLEYMNKLIEQGVKVDAIIVDPPYGTTACKWDVVIPFDKMWKCLNSLIKDSGAIVLTAINPFTALLISSNIEMFKYSLVWKKTRVSHFAQAPYRFLTEHEDIVVFSKAGVSKNSKIKMEYNPQGVKNTFKICKGKGNSEHRPSKKTQKNYIQTLTNYPKSILEFPSSTGELHPTQKPIELIKYLVRTYTKEKEIVLDFTMGSGTTAVACKELNRNFYGCELDPKYIEIANNRLKNITKDLFCS